MHSTKRQGGLWVQSLLVDSEPGSQFLRSLSEGKESLFRNTVGRTLIVKDPQRKYIITDSEAPSRLDPHGTLDPLNNTGLDCMAPHVCGCFSVNMHLALHIPKLSMSSDSTNCSWKTVLSICSWESRNAEGPLGALFYAS